MFLKLINFFITLSWPTYSNLSFLYLSSVLSGYFKPVRIWSHKRIRMVMGENIRLIWSRKKAFFKWTWNAWRPTKNTQPCTGLSAWIPFAHSLSWPWEKTPRQMSLEAAQRGTQKGTLHRWCLTTRAAFSASVANLSKVRASLRTHSSSRTKLSDSSFEGGDEDF